MTDRHRILVVEDDDAIAFVLTAYLGELGHQVVRVATGGEAVEQARTWAPDVALLDLTLPDMDGDEVIRGIRELDGSPSRLPVIVLSGSTGLDEIAGRIGATSALAKPFRLAELNEAIEQALRPGP